MDAFSDIGLKKIPRSHCAIITSYKKVVENFSQDTHTLQTTDSRNDNNGGQNFK